MIKIHTIICTNGSQLLLMLAAFMLCASVAWSQEVINEDAKFLPPGGSAGDWLGSSVAVDTNGIIAVGAMLEGTKGPLSGTAYVFDTDGNQILQLDASDAEVGDFFGASIAIDNGIIAVGAYGDDDNGTDSGSAYLFAMDGTHSPKLTPDDAGANDQFGYSIAIDDGIVAIGAIGESYNRGAVYIFDVSNGAQTHKLVASDASPFDLFGYSVAVDNGTVVVGAIGDSDLGSFSGSVYMFDAATGVQLAKLVPNDGTELDWFGSSVDIANGIVVVGSPLDDDNGSDSGSVYLFEVSTGNQIRKIIPADGQTNDQFGHSVSIDNGIVAVGMNGDDGFLGSAYLFDASTSAQLKKVLSYGGVAGDQFGHAVALGNGSLAVGAVYDSDQGTNAGAAFLFDAADSTDTFGRRIARLYPAGTTQYGQFGFSMDIDDNVMVVGAYFENARGTESGAVYLINASTGAWLHKFVPDDGQAGDNFGYSVAIDNGIVAIGAWFGDGLDTDTGSAYLFDAITGQQLTKLTASNGVRNDLFGISIAIDFQDDGSRGRVAVGASAADVTRNIIPRTDIESGFIYIFDADPNSPNFGNFPPESGNGRIAPNDQSWDMAFDNYGVSVAINLDALDGAGIIVGGSNGADIGGAAYVFNATTYSFNQRLLPNGGSPEWFGRSVAIDDSFIVVGAPLTANHSGAVYIFDTDVCAQPTQCSSYPLIANSIGPANDQFGRSVAIDNGVILVGARHHQGTGAAYIIENPQGSSFGSSGTTDAILLPISGSGGDIFGTAVAVSNGIIAVGSFHAGAYLFDQSPPLPCPADLVADGDLNFADVSAFLTAYGNQDPIADFFNDGVFNFTDVSVFLTAYGQGCP